MPDGHSRGQAQGGEISRQGEWFAASVELPEALAPEKEPWEAKQEEAVTAATSILANRLCFNTHSQGSQQGCELRNKEQHQITA